VGRVRISLFAVFLRAGFQHGSTGFSSGQYFGKYCSLKVFWREIMNSSTILPLCQGALSANRQTRPHCLHKALKNFTKVFWFFFLLKENTKARLVRAPNTFTLLY